MYYYVTNLQGDVVAILDTTGTAVVEYTYDAWGNILSTSGTMANTLGAAIPLTYRGYVYDDESELYYLQSRYYNPETSRFINADILVSTGQGLLGNNMFGYCLNNPILMSDTCGAASLVSFCDDIHLPLVPWKNGGGSTNHNGGFASWQRAYASESDAAAAFAREVYGASYYSRHEYSTEIYTKAIEGSIYYFYTKPQIGDPHRASGIDMRRVNNIVAYAHTHPNSNDFSDNDKSFADYYGINAYMIGPNWDLQRYSPYGEPFKDIPIVPIPVSVAQKAWLLSNLYDSWCAHFVDGKCPNVYYCTPGSFPAA